MNDLKQYIENNKDRFLEELFSLIRIPSISSKSENKPDMQRCAERWAELIKDAGADMVEIHQTEGAPIVYGEKMVDPKAPTVLVYGHYDVMPVEPIDLWNTPPFEPTIIDGKIFARGADDDKGQSFIHAKAFEYMVKTNQLPCNVKFMIEGEEEIGSNNLYTFCENNKQKLQADVILVSDTSMIAADVPSINIGLRGLTYLEIKVVGPCRDLHSGVFGGSVANPINVLCKMLTDMIDENGKITVPGFYDDVLEVSAEERHLMAQAPFDEQEYKDMIGIKEVYGEKGYSTLERSTIRPSFDICGMWGGYIGEGSKTVLPSEANAKVSMRIVPNQDHNKIMELFKKHFEAMAPDYATVTVTPHHGGPAYVSPIDLPAYKAAEKAIMDTYGKQTLPSRSGGSIPIIAGFESILGIKSILLGFGLEEDGIHSPNECFPLEQLFKGIETVPHFYKYFAEMQKK